MKMKYLIMSKSCCTMIFLSGTLTFTFPRALRGCHPPLPSMCFLQMSAKLPSRKQMNACKCCLVVAEGSFTWSSVVCMQRSCAKKKKRRRHWGVQERRLAAHLLHVVRFISRSFKQRLRSPTRWPPPGWVYFAELWNHKSSIMSPAFPKVFLVAGLKFLRERSFLCSGKTSAPAVLTVIPLRQHSMILFRNINIYTVHVNPIQVACGECTMQKHNWLYLTATSAITKLCSGRSWRTTAMRQHRKSEYVDQMFSCESREKSETSLR